MTKRIIAIMVAAFLFTQTKAQFYFNVGAGYGLATAPQGYLTNDTYDYGTVFNATTTVTAGLSYGKGTHFLFAAGTMINPNIGVELGINYLAGAKYTNTFISTGGNTNNQTTTNAGSMLRLCPTLLLTTGKSNVKPYIKTGLIVGVNPTIKETSNSVGTSGSSSNKYESSGNISFGFTNSLGVNIEMSNALSFFSELNIITQAWSPKKIILKEFTQNGVDQLPSLQNFYKETDFVSFISTNGTNDYNSPRQTTKISSPFSSIGLNVGLHFSMSGNSNAKKGKRK